MLSVLFVTSGWPSTEHPDRSAFVSEQADALRALGVHVDVVHFLGETNPINYMRMRRRVRAQVRDNSYDLIHAHFGQTLLTVLPSKLPVVASFYGSDLIGVVGGSGRYTARGAILTRISRAAARRVDAVIVLSRSLGERLPIGVEFDVIPLGVDPSLFTPLPKHEARRRLGLDDERSLVLFGGRPSQPVKRLGLARRAVEVLSDPSIDLLTIEARPRDEVVTYMSACDALLVTSRHESGPLIVKEALACNLPVVSVDVGDVREWIDGVPGCVLCVDDRPETIGSGLRKVLDGADRFEGRHLVVDRLDQRVLAGRVADVYRRVLERP